MRKLLLICVVLSTSVVAGESRYVAADQSMETALCVSAATANTAEFKQELKYNRVRSAVAANKLLCNDIPVASFAFSAGNTAVYQHLKQYVRGRVDIQDIALAPAQGTLVVRGR